VQCVHPAQEVGRRDWLDRWPALTVVHSLPRCARATTVLATARCRTGAIRRKPKYSTPRGLCNRRSRMRWRVPRERLIMHFVVQTGAPMGRAWIGRRFTHWTRPSFVRTLMNGLCAGDHIAFVGKYPRCRGAHVRAG
jgi:hypothetical protein